MTIEDVGASELDINALCVENPVATYFMRATGESMVGAGIFNGDLLVVDRALEPCSGDVVVAELDGGFVVKRYVVGQGVLRLESCNAQGEPNFDVTNNASFEIFGVVRHSIRALRG